VKQGFSINATRFLTPGLSRQAPFYWVWYSLQRNGKGARAGSVHPGPGGVFLRSGNGRLYRKLSALVRDNPGVSAYSRDRPKFAVYAVNQHDCRFHLQQLWILISGGKTITCEQCFGTWEKLLGTLSPTQALLVDFSLLGLALAIFTISSAPAGIFQYPQER